MGGSNCWVPGCGLSRDTKNVYFWKLPCTSHPDDIKWRKSMEDMIRRHRVVDKLLSDRLASGKVFTCERHFKDEDFEYTATGRKKVKLYTMPSLNLPKKSHEMLVNDCIDATDPLLYEYNSCQNPSHRKRTSKFQLLFCYRLIQRQDHCYYC